MERFFGKQKDTHGKRKRGLKTHGDSPIHSGSKIGEET